MATTMVMRVGTVENMPTASPCIRTVAGPVSEAFAMLYTPTTSLQWRRWKLGTPTTSLYWSREEVTALAVSTTWRVCIECCRTRLWFGCYSDSSGVLSQCSMTNNVCGTEVNIISNHSSRFSDVMCIFVGFRILCSKILVTCTWMCPNYLTQILISAHTSQGSWQMCLKAALLSLRISVSWVMQVSVLL